MRMPCDCIDAAMPVDVTLSASQACSLMMRNVIHCRVRPLQQWHASRASGGWSRPTPRRLLMNTTACTVLSRHSCELFPQVVIGPSLHFSIEKAITYRSIVTLFQLRTHMNCPARVFEHFLSRKLNLRSLEFEWRCKLRARLLVGECASHMIITSCVRYILVFRS